MGKGFEVMGWAGELGRRVVSYLSVRGWWKKCSAQVMFS